MLNGRMIESQSSSLFLYRKQYRPFSIQGYLDKNVYNWSVYIHTQHTHVEITITVVASCYPYWQPLEPAYK